MKKKELHIEEFEELLLDELNEMQDYVLCPMDILDTVRCFIDDYIDQEVNKKLDELDGEVKNIKL
tara:strand:- start:2677 stop:2871 length:195 start_codon:yes stop_codon:yes gene_type:complete